MSIPAEIDNITYSTLTVTNLATCYYLRRYIKEQIIEFSRWIPSWSIAGKCLSILDIRNVDFIWLTLFGQNDWSDWEQK